MHRLLVATLIATAGCTSAQTTTTRETSGSAATEAQLPYADATDMALPTGSLNGLSMDAAAVDVDNDGDLDVVVAHEFRANILLINDGSGRFADESARRLPRASHDSEDIGVADFDGDGDQDIIIVSEDDEINELYINDGAGFFSDETRRRLPARGVTNGVAVGDVDADGDPDLVFANNGQNFVLINNAGVFTDETAIRLPPLRDVSQDVELGDVDGDGDLDLLVGNESDNRLLLNDGTGLFTDAPERLPLREATEETRDADFGDIDSDGDLDIFFGNVQFFRRGAALENRLLVNDGRGFFTDESAARLPQHDDHTVDGDFVDIDGDGHLDLVTANANNLNIGGQAPYRALLNDGTGVFRDDTAEMFPPTLRGIGFDVEAADVNGDRQPDFYFASRRGADRLALGQP